MEKSKLYTRTGDKGTTSLVGGQRVKKNSIRIEAYGTVDEFSSHLGVLLAHTSSFEVIHNQLIYIQHKLFNIGGYLATDAPQGSEPKPAWGLTDEDCRRVEKWIDELDSKTPKANAFVLPGGVEASAQAHVARTVCRRTERRILDLAETAPVDNNVITFFNRLSDYLFILARHLNHLAGVSELTWDKDI